MNESISVEKSGSVRLVSVQGSDDSIAESARIGRDGAQSTRRLVRYMMRHRHTSPFEFVTFIFHVRLPIFVARQWMRHRMGTFNEWSGRYMELPHDYWVPDQWRGRSATNRQGSEGTVAHEVSGWKRDRNKGPENPDENGSHAAEEVAFLEYNHRTSSGVANEQARSCLPLSTYTEFYWKVDLHNLLHFLSLRNEGHAQKEIRDYAGVIEGIVTGCVPIVMDAYNEFRKNAVTFSATEIRFLRGEDVDFESKSEMEECVAKCVKAGLIRMVPREAIEKLENSLKAGLIRMVPREAIEKLENSTVVVQP